MGLLFTVRDNSIRNGMGGEEGRKKDSDGKKRGKAFVQAWIDGRLKNGEVLAREGSSFLLSSSFRQTTHTSPQHYTTIHYFACMERRIKHTCSSNKSNQDFLFFSRHINQRRSRGSKRERESLGPGVCVFIKG